ncbi:MAG: hypothetical protein A3D64_03175 [Candidatus Wildermuthbacteria bacterium RIFCSPHIGHO2_02_FULL_49_9]|uniref:Uncharacterized protein n=2 Tax=Parcubacteria group TaxID=1794811 RepID=A0A1F6BWJ2_9BACT|nr:MAG: hypothetical protein A3A21_04155 [Candidatus Jorgensenbacteria bacterium RIFCSPLOWO2_01_FULL_45_25b]OHA70350.1 MAG: hypothetical protein A3D64_03175 [Candidatus Wildermuthbacteria bacterium RIFCSPHIGHO2_02_FULL_49_9]
MPLQIVSVSADIGEKGRGPDGDLFEVFVTALVTDRIGNQSNVPEVSVSAEFSCGSYTPRDPQRSGSQFSVVFDLPVGDHRLLVNVPTAVAGGSVRVLIRRTYTITWDEPIIEYTNAGRVVSVCGLVTENVNGRISIPEPPVKVVFETDGSGVGEIFTSGGTFSFKFPPIQKTSATSARVEGESARVARQVVVPVAKPARITALSRLETTPGEWEFVVLVIGDNGFPLPGVSLHISTPYVKYAVAPASGFPKTDTLGQLAFTIHIPDGERQIVFDVQTPDQSVKLTEQAFREEDAM